MGSYAVDLPDDIAVDGTVLCCTSDGMARIVKLEPIVKCGGCRMAGWCIIRALDDGIEFCSAGRTEDEPDAE